MRFFIILADGIRWNKIVHSITVPFICVFLSIQYEKQNTAGHKGQCALGLRCIVDVEFSRWRRRSRNFPGYMLYISIDIVLFWESYPQLHKLILIYDFFVKKKNQHSSLQSKTRSTKIHPLRAWNLNRRCLENYNFYHSAHWRQKLVLSVFTKTVLRQGINAAQRSPLFEISFSN